MKISHKWLKKYIDSDLPPEEIADVLTSIGLEVETWEEVESVKGGLKGLVVGEVMACEKHPNADKLSLTKVNIGQEELLSIVCGAPNVAKGQKVIVATVGTNLYPTSGESFTIKKGKIRGELSEGMLCAEDEIGLGKGHDGIMILPQNAAIGSSVASLFSLENDIVYEIGLTPNRSDAMGHLGVAFDLHAALTIRGIKSSLTKPSVHSFIVEENTSPITVSVENTQDCPRYTGLSISELEVKESPDWLKQSLTAIGVRPINNVVDATNYVLHELGQALHAFDADKIVGKKVIVKNLPENTSFVSLDGHERKLSTHDLMICDAQSNGMCIAGVFGGLNSGVSSSTKNIFLESAKFDAKSVRKTSDRHQLKTDASKCFEKGTDINGTEYALKRAALLIKELAGGKISSSIIDIYPNPYPPAKVLVRYSRINELIGVELQKTEIKRILQSLTIDIIEETEFSLLVSIPTNKIDVTREADVIEEILRIYGLNNVPIPSNIRSAISYSKQPDAYELKNRVADYLSATGFSESMSLSITQSKYFQNLYPTDASSLVYINNTSNQHLDVMRPTLLFGGLEAVVRNQNRQISDVLLYEFGKTYIKTEDKYIETNHLGLWISGNESKESWLNPKPAKVSFFTLKAYVHKLIHKLGLNQLQATESTHPSLSYGIALHRGQQKIVDFGLVKPLYGKNIYLDPNQPPARLKKEVYFAEFNWDLIIKLLAKKNTRFTELEKHLAARRDLALVIDNSISFKEIEEIALKTDKKRIKAVNLFDIYTNESQIGKDKKSYAVSFHFSSDEGIEKTMEQLIKNYQMQLNAEIRR